MSIVGFEFQGLVEVGCCEQGLSVLQVRPTALVKVGRLVGIQLTRTGQIGNRVLEIVTGCGCNPTPAEFGGIFGLVGALRARAGLRLILRSGLLDSGSQVEDGAAVVSEEQLVLTVGDIDSMGEEEVRANQNIADIQLEIADSQ